MNSEIGVDMYTLMCIKLMTNKDLLYKKINKIKFKNSRKKMSEVVPIKTMLWSPPPKKIKNTQAKLKEKGQTQN